MGGGGGGYNLDSLDPSAFGGDAMTFENKPKRAPPARFANKGKKEEKDDDKGGDKDVEMKDEETKKPEPKKKSPANAKPPKAEEEN